MPSLPLAGSDARTVETTGPAQQESCQEALTGEDPMFETQYEALRRQGISRRSFLQFCSLTAASLGIGSAGAKDIAEAMETKPRTPVIWLHGLECTCCTESFIRSYHPVAKDLVLSMISLDYDDTIMAAAGHQAEAALEDTIEKYKGNYILAVEGNVPLNDDGVNCIPGGETFLRKIKHVAAGAKAVIGWGSCAAWGCVQVAKPNPTHAVPITEIITDKPIVLVPGCPPIPEVMTGVVTYILTYDRLPPLDRMGRPKMFYGQRIHDKCYRRAHFDAGQFVEKFDDEGAKLGYCLYKVGCKGPTSYNACSAIRWNEGLSWPVQSGHGCIGCSEPNFFDKGSFYEHETTVLPPGWGGIEATADKVGLATLGVVGVAAAAHVAMSAVSQARAKKTNKDIGGKEE